MFSIIWWLRPSSMVEEFLKIRFALPCVSLACWRWENLAFAVMVGLVPGSSRYYHGFPTSNVAYRVSLMIRPTWTCFTPARVVGRVTALAYNTWIIFCSDSYSGSPLSVGRVLMTNLVTSFAILLGSDIFDIFEFSFVIRTSLIVFSFVDGVVDYGGVFIQLVLKITLVDRRHLFLT